MLTGLLPGLRHVRSPFVAGCCFLLAAWLVWGRHLPPEGEATGLLADAYRLGRYVGQPIVLALVAFIAYMIGSTAVWFFNQVTWNIRRLARFIAERLVDSDESLRQRLGGWVLERLGRDPWEAVIGDPAVYLINLRDDWSQDEQDDLIEGEERRLNAVIADDLSKAPTRLIDFRPDLYAEFDRRSSDGRGQHSLRSGWRACSANVGALRHHPENVLAYRRVRWRHNYCLRHQGGVCSQKRPRAYRRCCIGRSRGNADVPAGS